ncbi:MAG: hemerythrin domain-containing protein [Deltaproteobacteria bacterium]|nr:MAG: hemerythrin domain-containing protein [Deltaproteobacteria bacterium]
MPADLLREHEYVRTLFDRLRAVLAAPDDCLPAARWQRLLDHELRALRSALARHFRHEEHGEYLKPVRHRRPTLAPKLADLQAQHAVFRSTVDELIAANAAGTPRAELRPRIEALLARLSAHEAAETELLQEALAVDLGGGD